MSEASQGAHPAGAKAAPGGALPISQEARQEGLRLVLRVFGAFLLMLAIGVSMLAGPDEWLSQSEVEQKIEKIAQGMPDAASKAFEAIDQKARQTPSFRAGKDSVSLFEPGRCPGETTK